MGTLGLRKFGFFGVGLGVGRRGMAVGVLKKWIASLELPPGSAVAICVTCVEVVLLVCSCFELQFSGCSQK
jgi:hypothetical protein